VTDNAVWWYNDSGTMKQPVMASLPYYHISHLCSLYYIVFSVVLRMLCDWYDSSVYITCSCSVANTSDAVKSNPLTFMEKPLDFFRTIALSLCKLDYGHTAKLIQLN